MILILYISILYAYLWLVYLQWYVMTMHTAQTLKWYIWLLGRWNQSGISEKISTAYDLLCDIESKCSWYYVHSVYWLFVNSLEAQVNLLKGGPQLSTRDLNIYAFAVYIFFSTDSPSQNYAKVFMIKFTTWQGC